MEPSQPRLTRTPTIVCLSILGLLVIAAILFGACNPGSVTNNQQPAATQSPSPQSSTSPQESPRGDTPIVVKGGGSVDLEFDDGIFTGPSHSCADCTITYLTLVQIPNAGDPPSATSPTRCDLGAGTEPITIDTIGNSDDIVITRTAGVAIDFNATRFGHVIDDCGNERQHHSHSGGIKGVKVGMRSCDGCRGNPKRCLVEIVVNKP